MYSSKKVSKFFIKSKSRLVFLVHIHYSPLTRIFVEHVRDQKDASSNAEIKKNFSNYF